jgi:hypothetical protein
MRPPETPSEFRRRRGTVERKESATMSSELGVAALVIMAAVSVVWTAMLVAALLEFRRLSWRLHEFIRVVEMELKPAVAEAREALRGAQRATQGVVETTARLQESVSAFQQAGENVRVTTEAIRSVFGSRLIPVASVLAGLRTGGKVLWKMYMRRREMP